MDGQNIDTNQVNQTPVNPVEQTTYPPPQSVLPKKSDIKGGLLWFAAPFLTLIGLIFFIILLHAIKAPDAITSPISFLGGIAVLALFPIGIIRGIAKFSGK